MVVDGTDSKLDAFQGVGCQKFIDREVIHERFVVVDLVLCFFQACNGGRAEEGGIEGSGGMREGVREVEKEEERRERERGQRGGRSEGSREEGNRDQVFIWGRGLWDLPPRISCHNQYIVLFHP